ncbi:MAG: zinc-binding alcohol dehydrogenase family protein [Deinococcales bacterium]
MKSIVLAEVGRFEAQPLPEPVNLAEHALVKVERVGICGTDLHAFQGRQPFFSYPRILGHELAVTILEVPKESDLKLGDCCAVIPYLHDETCVACRQGKSNCCVNMQVLGVHRDGGMCEYLSLPLSHLIAANDLSLEALALVEMLSIGQHAVTRAQMALTQAESVLVIGAGPIGLATLVFVREALKTLAKNIPILALDISASRLDFVQSQGLAQIVQADGDILDNLKDKQGDLPTLIFDATGNAASMMKAPEYCAHGGTVVYVGFTRQDLSFHNPLIHSRELSLLCSRNATKQDFEKVIASLRRGEVDVESWISHKTDAEGLIRDFASWTKPETGVIKAMLTAF